MSKKGKKMRNYVSKNVIIMLVEVVIIKGVPRFCHT